MEVLGGKLGVELGGDLDVEFVAGGEDVGEFGPSGVRVGLPLFGKALHSDDFGVGILGGPGGQEDVVLDVRGHDVLDGSERSHLVFDGGRQCDGGEDGDVSALELDQRPAAADLDVAES